MTAHQVGVGALVHEQRIHGFLPVTQTGGTHGYHRIVPSPCLVPVPAVPYPVEGILHDVFIEESGVGNNTIGTEHGGMVADVFDVRIGVGGIGSSQIKSVLMCQRVHLHRVTSHFQGPLPISQFEGRIDGGFCRKRFLCGNAAAEGISGGSLAGRLAGIVKHKLGSLINQRMETFDIRSCTPEQFCEIDEMRLLPDEVTAGLGRSLFRTGIGHLHPSDTLIALALCNLAGHRFCAEIPVERSFQ